ncbi:MAG TPA: hypothetical protein VKB88_11745 [Bryobacteraceae bacterium]|nr:hypothetical protein [Bryobacteraceae bacterium]
MLKATIGCRAHSGWAVAVTVAGGRAIERRRIELCDCLVSGSAQPYHAAAKLPLPEAHSYIRRCADISVAMAEQALRQLLADLAARNCRAARSIVLMGSGRLPGELAKTLASHPLIHTAEGEFYRGVIADAFRRCGVPVYGVAERELCERLEEGAELGRDLGRPWRRDEKLCALAASQQKVQDLRLVLSL